MKKFIPLLLCLALLITTCALLGGCRKNEYLYGTWEGEVTYTDLIAEALSGNALLTEYCDIRDFTLTAILTFRKDGTYTLEIDEASARDAFQNIRTALTDGYMTYWKIHLRDMDLAVDKEAFLTEKRNLLDELLEAHLGDPVILQLIARVCTEGNYKTENGKLYTSKSVEAAVEEDRYETYVVSGNEMRILSYVGSESEKTAWLYPMVFYKAS